MHFSWDSARPTLAILHHPCRLHKRDAPLPGSPRTLPPKPCSALPIRPRPAPACLSTCRLCPPRLLNPRPRPLARAHTDVLTYLHPLTAPRRSAHWRTCLFPPAHCPAPQARTARRLPPRRRPRRSWGARCGTGRSCRTRSTRSSTRPRRRRRLASRCAALHAHYVVHYIMHCIMHYVMAPRARVCQQGWLAAGVGWPEPAPLTTLMRLLRWVWVWRWLSGQSQSNPNVAAASQTRALARPPCSPPALQPSRQYTHSPTRPPAHLPHTHLPSPPTSQTLRPPSPPAPLSPPPPPRRASASSWRRRRGCSART